MDETVADVAEDCEEAQEDDLDEANQLAALVGLVDARRAQGEFPLLQPRELLHDSVVSDDQDTLPLVRIILNAYPFCIFLFTYTHLCSQTLIVHCLSTDYFALSCDLPLDVFLIVLIIISSISV